VHVQVATDLLLAKQARQLAPGSGLHLAAAFSQLRWYRRQIERGVHVVFGLQRTRSALGVDQRIAGQSQPEGGGALLQLCEVGGGPGEAHEPRHERVRPHDVDRQLRAFEPQDELVAPGVEHTRDERQ